MEKDWSRPELIVLVREKPEEAVLQTCKGGSTGDPNNFFDYCQLFGGGMAPDCVECQTLNPS